MSAQAIKPMASLDAAMLGSRPNARRVPLSFAPSEAETPAELPEVVRQMARLTEAYADDKTGDLGETGTPGRRIAFTVRLDATRHGRLRAVAHAQARSAAQVLVDALDQYCTAATDPAAHPASSSSPSTTPTGNKS